MPISSAQIAAMAPISQNMSPYGQMGPQAYGGMGMGGYQMAPQAFGMGYGPAPMVPQAPAVGHLGPYGGVGLTQNWSMGGGSQGAPQLMGERIASSGANALSTLGTGLGWVNTGAGIASMLGIGGAGMAALGGIPVAAGVGAFAYGAQQMGAGVQERVQVNRALRSNFGGMSGIGSGAGGRGFSSGEMGQVSQMVRSLANNDMFSNVEELTRVMDQTAQMGLYRGVRSAKEFQTKFKQTVDSLKEISTIMGTTLEGAATFMSQGRNLGFFTGQEITENMLQARLTSASTGMSMDQVMQLQQTGTQMGRAMGMRGRSGAQAALSIGGNIAQAMRMGVLTDEQVAEATGGLQGAEAVQAMTMQSMEGNQRWLSRGAGRAMMAGLWNREGGFDEGLLRRVREGSISMNELRTIGRRNIAETGGRNSEFFRDQERLRGDLMTQHGGGSMLIGAYAEHLSRRRGASIDDPIVQRLLRRRTGWSQDRLEAELQMYRKAPEIEAQAAVGRRQEIENIAGTKSREVTGIQGRMRKMSDWWTRTVEEPFREAGDRFVTSWSKRMEDMQDRMEGRVKLAISAESKEALRAYAMTGQGSTGIMQGSEYTNYQNQLLQWRAKGGGGIDWGRMSQGMGVLLGTRSQETEGQQAIALGLANYSSGYGYYTGSGKDRKVIDSTAISGMVRDANERIHMATAKGMGLSESEASRMGTAARQAMTGWKSGADLASFKRRMEGATLEQKKQATLEQINFLKSKSPEIARAFNRAGSDFVKQLQLFNVLAEEGGFSGTAFGPAMGGTGVSIQALEKMDRLARMKQEAALEGLAKIDIGGTGRPAEKYVGSFGDADIFGSSSQIVGGPGRLDATIVGELVKHGEVGGLLKTWATTKSASEARDVLSKMKVAAEGSDTLSESQKNQLGMLLEGTEKNERSIKNRLREYYQAGAYREGTALAQRNAEVGREMQRGLEKGKYLFEDRKLMKVHDLASKIAAKRANNEDASALERELLSDPESLKNPDVQKVLSETPGLEYLGRGMAEATVIARELASPRGEGPSRGLSKTARLLRMTLQSAGMGTVGGEQLRRLTALGEKGDTKGMMAALRKMAGGDEAKLAALKGYETFIGGSVEMMKDGKIDEGERSKFAGMLGAGRVQGLAIEGVKNEVTATQQYQQKSIDLMVKQLKAMTAIASGQNLTASALKDLDISLKKEGYGGGEAPTT